MEYKRTDRIGEAIKEEISSIILQQVSDPRIQFVSITRVQVSADFHYAKVFFSVLGSEKERMQALEGLKSARGFIQRNLGRRIRLRYTPEITFKMDTSIDQGIHICELLREIKNKEEASKDEK